MQVRSDCSIITCTHEVTRVRDRRESGSMNTVKPFERSMCAIANSLDILGDKWSLLVVRDLAPRQAHLRRAGRFSGGHSDQHPRRSPQASGKRRHRQQHSLSGAACPLCLYGHVPPVQRAGRGVARVCAMGQTIHPGHRRIETWGSVSGDVAASAANSRRRRAKRAG